MTHNILGKTEKKKKNNRIKAQGGFSALEVLISVCILIPIMAGAMHVFSEGINQQVSEQQSIEANQDASAGFDLMTTEIAQAGSHGDITTTIQQNIIGSTTPQYVSVDSSEGFCDGDYLTVINNAGDTETVQLDGVGYENTLSGVFLNDYVVGDKITDFLFGRNLGATPCLVRTGYGDTESARLVELGLERADIFDNVLEAAKYIVGKEREGLS